MVEDGATAELQVGSVCHGQQQQQEREDTGILSWEVEMSPTSVRVTRPKTTERTRWR